MSKNMSIALFLISAQLHIVVELPCHTVYLVLFRNPPSPTTYATPNQPSYSSLYYFIIFCNISSNPSPSQTPYQSNCMSRIITLHPIAPTVPL